MHFFVFVFYHNQLHNVQNNVVNLLWSGEKTKQKTLGLVKSSSEPLFLWASLRAPPGTDYSWDLL